MLFSRSHSSLMKAKAAVGAWCVLGTERVHGFSPDCGLGLGVSSYLKSLRPTQANTIEGRVLA
jgi:hypothetical protein